MGPIAARGGGRTSGQTQSRDTSSREGRDRSTPGFEVDGTVLSCADATPVCGIYFFIKRREIWPPAGSEPWCL
jgi:hypothetical protein